VAQLTSTLAYGKAADTRNGNALAWRWWLECLTVIRVNGGLGSIQAFCRTGA
jgi:hypothetical protein